MGLRIYHNRTVPTLSAGRARSAGLRGRTGRRLCHEDGRSPGRRRNEDTIREREHLHVVDREVRVGVVAAVVDDVVNVAGCGGSVPAARRLVHARDASPESALASNTILRQELRRRTNRRRG